MHIHPAIRALRGDDAPQRAAQQAAHDAMASWADSLARARLRAELDAFATTREMADCPLLAALFEEGDPAAGELAGSFAAAGARVLARQPFAHLPQRHSTDGTVSMMLLARSGNVMLTLCAIDGEGFARQPQARNASFWPGESWEHVLAGSARADLVERRGGGDDAATLVPHPIRLEPGRVICRNAERQALVHREISGALVTLRLQRRRPQAGPSREYALDTGRLAHQAAGNPRDSRVELMMALLGRMKRRDAAPLLAGIAAGEGSEALRWQALREGLALDTAAGFGALCRVAADSGDPLAAPAGALRSQLIETYPQLARIDPCPA